MANLITIIVAVAAQKHTYTSTLLSNRKIQRLWSILNGPFQTFQKTNHFHNRGGRANL
jgi:hypothetical protein